MTHAELSSMCKRRPCEPASECGGLLDAAEIFPEEDFLVVIRKCQRCGNTLSVEHHANGPMPILRNDWAEK